ncbi:30S ribosomal protein S16 [Candidatus Roizmanbacteria bacterium]|nr:30S ribosomal protein S16 [Candidatus Roizmanbacteria bacterium]
MPATIRLARIGKKRQPNYRIVVVDKRKKRNTRYLEKIGFYNPLDPRQALNIDMVKFDQWVKKGAEISEGMRKLLKLKTKSNLVKKDSA